MLLSFETSSMVKYLTGKKGRALILFRPLEWMITETHARGFEFTLDSNRAMDLRTDIHKPHP
jgi:hypothetical protein